MISKCMTIKILKTEGLIGMDNITWCRSGRLNALQPGDFQFSLENADKDQIRFFNLNVTPIQSTYYLTLQEQEPYETLIRIENCSDDLSLIVGTQEIPLGPKLKMPYAWVEPSKNEEIPIIVEYKNQRPTNLPKMMCLLKKVNCEVTQVLNYPDKTSLTVSYYVVLEGGARVLKFNYNALAANYKNPYSRKISVIFEIESVGVSIIGKPNNNKSELLYISVYKALGIIDYENERNSWHFQAQDLHIDNNMNENVLFPVLFSSINEDGLFFQLDVKFKNRKKKLEVNFSTTIYFRLSMFLI